MDRSAPSHFFVSNDDIRISAAGMRRNFGARAETICLEISSRWNRRNAVAAEVWLRIARELRKITVQSDEAA